MIGLIGFRFRVLGLGFRAEEDFGFIGFIKVRV